MSAKRIRGGFTLVELMVVLTLLSVLLTMAVPSMHNLLHRVTVRLETARLLGAIKLARSEAVQRNVAVSVCPTNLAADAGPACGGVFANGWMVYANPDRDALFDPRSDQLIRSFGPLPAGYSLTNRAGTIAATGNVTYLPDGSSRRPRTLMICSPRAPSVASSSIVLNRVGRPRLAAGWGTCPVPRA